MADVQERSIEYHDQGTDLEGFLAEPAATYAVGSKLPAVLIIHDWKGLGEYPKSRARQLARLGYVAFALDQYGKGIYAKDHQEAAALLAPHTKDSNYAVGRTKAGLQQLLNHPRVDASKIVAMGYCFGGACVLELARHGGPVAGVASFHGGVKSWSGVSSANIKCRVAVFNGYDDPRVTREDIQKVTQEMSEGKVDFTFVDFGNTVHAFTVPGAGGAPHLRYTETADLQSFAFLEFWLRETFGGVAAPAAACCASDAAPQASCH
ncbi:dienelactone hydrolase [Capsaspora owczarzaki ATCC 30864]|nr:dienelactone hydrolase [Capsaspora owczarzaki ATCC 30864]|eukprot:XP_004347480.1 dienelactone hydrolase [Capsaspora owczarzaki ATCC 30864]